MAPAQTLTSSQDDGSRHAYATLDCLRGVAAFMVVLYHFASNVFAPHGFLAVDLFFAMSGFVIASAYERRLVNGLGLGGFFVIRARRLGPLLALGAAMSLACALAVSGEQRPLPWLALLSVLLVPIDGAFLRAFPLNGSLWSLHVEVVVNLVYACLARVLSTPRLLAVAGASLVALAVISCTQGAMSDGSSELDMLCGYLRALVAFPAGVVIWRWRARLPAWRIGPATILAAAALLISGVGVPAQGLHRRRLRPRLPLHRCADAGDAGGPERTLGADAPAVRQGRLGLLRALRPARTDPAGRAPLRRCTRRRHRLRGNRRGADTGPRRPGLGRRPLLRRPGSQVVGGVEGGWSSCAGPGQHLIAGVGDNDAPRRQRPPGGVAPPTQTPTLCAG